MKSQRTIKGRFSLTGIDPAGGNPVYVTFSPLDSDSGIWFSTKRGRLPFKKEHIRTTRSIAISQSMILSDGRTGFMNIEHPLATFMAYEIDNIEVYLDRELSLSSRLLRPLGKAKRIEIFPNIPFLQRSLCDMIEDVGLEEQEGTVRKLRMNVEAFESEDGRLKFERLEGDELRVRAFTQYVLRNGDIVRGEREIALNPRDYREIACARAFCGAALKPPRGYSEGSRKTGLLHGAPVWLPKDVMKFIGKFLYLSYGLGHGMDETYIFYPASSERKWRENEIIRDEIAAHTCIDRGGDVFAVLQATYDARPAGIRVTSRFASHRNAYETVRENLDKFEVVD